MKFKLIVCCIAFVLVFTAAFSACGEDPATYVDPAGESHLAVLDESGNTIVNDEGDIVVYQTEENGDIATNSAGEPMTQGSVFPEVIENNGVVQTLTYDVKLPTGWAVDELNSARFNKALSTAKITIDIRENTTAEQDYDTLVQYFQALKDGTEQSTDANEFTYTTGTMEYVAAKADAKTIELKATVTGEGSESRMYLIFENSGNVYRITYTAYNDDFNTEDFASFYTAITYKDYLYY